MRARLIAAVLLLTCLSQASAQSVRGKVIDALDHRPVRGALVEVRDMLGKSVAQVLTSSAGVFAVTVPAADRYQLRIAAIGYSRRAPSSIMVTDGGLVVPDIELSQIAIRLPDLRMLTGKQLCGNADKAADTFMALLDAAQVALQVMEATVASRQFTFDVAKVRSLTEGKGAKERMSADTTHVGLQTWPVEALPPDSLAVFGFSRDLPTANGAERNYYGPDHRVIFSDWFLATHCFTIDQKLSKGDTLHVLFAPEKKGKLIDVSGDLVLDRNTMALLQLEFRHENLPNWVPKQASGGTLHFAQMTGGLWVPVDWAIWAPMIRMERSISRPVLISGGRSGMTRVYTAPPPTGTVVGRVQETGKVVSVIPVVGRQ